MLAVLLLLEGNLAGAEQAYREARMVQDRLEHRSPASVPGGAVATLEGDRATTAADDLLREALAFVQRRNGPDSWEAVSITSVWAYVRLQAGRFAEAEPLARESLAIREKIGPDDWATFHARSMLGQALAGQGRFAEAEPLLLAGAEGLLHREARIPTHHRIRLNEAVEQLDRLYTGWGRPEDAAQWRQRLAELDQAKSP